MKKIATLIMSFVLVGVLATSCSSTSSLTSSNTAAYASGSSCATALTALNSSRTTNGTISLTNTTDLANMLTVVTCYTNLKNNKDNADYKQSFTSGLIAGSNLITTSNATTIVNTLLNSSSLSGVNASNITSKAQTVSSIITLLNALKN